MELVSVPLRASAGEPAEERSSWVDPRTGVREEAAFHGPEGSRWFGVLAVPPGAPSGGVVICSPLQAEMVRNYRREVLLARTLAAWGVAVQRFHYLGSGHSDGRVEEMTLESMVEDALRAADHLVDRAGVGAVAYLGTRWGGLVAAAAAAGRRAPLALWEPVVSPDRYFEEVLRFRLMAEMKADPSSPLTSAILLRQMEQEGRVDVLGHTLERALYRSAAGVGLLDLVGEGTGDVLLVQVGVGRSLRGEYASLVREWSARGLAVEAQAIQDRETWWISGDLWQVHEKHPPTGRLVALTSEWVAARLGVEGGRR